MSWVGVLRSIPKARARKVAICARVVSSVGQYRAGSVAHPTVIPEAARAFMLARWELFSATSANLFPDSGSNWNARTRNEAISWRVTGSVGQNRAGSVEHPRVIPRSARRST